MVPDLWCFNVPWFNLMMFQVFAHMKVIPIQYKLYFEFSILIFSCAIPYSLVIMGTAVVLSARTSQGETTNVLQCTVWLSYCSVGQMNLMHFCLTTFSTYHEFVKRSPHHKSRSTCNPTLLWHSYYSRLTDWFHLPCQYRSIDSGCLRVIC